MSPRSKKIPDGATSVVISVILALAITIALAALVLLMALQMPNLSLDPEVPVIFKITKIRHIDSYGRMTYESRVILQNTAKTGYQNWNLYAITYVNGKKIPAEIPTLNANEQAADTHHHGVQVLEGEGASGSRKNGNAVWTSGERLAIDYSDQTIHPEDSVTIEIYDATTKKIISRDTYPHTEESNQEKMMDLYLSRQGA
ncbi:MAG: hypothetical protein M0R30_01715 [Methanoregula sp.]|uniref:hypothetical protein n=1 Tax=Methanoregula sp. TaxID=2052170 RepID=UPI0025EA1EAF|nr:hypothetical protein [Methanoregula sp.]MCK9630332.1 hypothetical protein [Methanoregula sp.]